MKNFRFTFFSTIVILILAACTPQVVSPTQAVSPGVAESPVAAGVSATTTSLPPTPTVVEPSATIPATATLLPSPTITLTPTPLADFSLLRVITLESNTFGWMIQINLPGVSQSLLLRLDGKEYRCSLDERYPERLFCQGLAKPPIDQAMQLVFVNPENGEEIYRGSLIIPLAFVVPPTPVGYLHTACEERGKNVSCETECRIDPNGNPCIVATCTDACGPYFAVHSCPDDMPLPSPSCSAEQWAMMKKRYQIP
ncbi:MAG: hypothetical protein KatS3mg045_1570 [Bellilinea sp.]|nr:MAG: hypothetical protein KatS3mg045_1570 [Bellilinea sp.]